MLSYNKTSMVSLQAQDQQKKFPRRFPYFSSVTSWGKLILKQVCLSFKTFFGDRYIYSPDLNVGFSDNVMRRNQMLVTILGLDMLTLFGPCFFWFVLSFVPEKGVGMDSITSLIEAMMLGG